MFFNSSLVRGNTSKAIHHFVAKMPLTITNASESDMDRLMEVQFAAMAQEPYHHVLFPSPNTPSARAQAGTRTLSDWLNDPSEKVLKVVDTDTSEIISFGKWNVYTDERSKAEWDQHMEFDWTTDPTLKEGAETFLREIHGMRHKYATAQPDLPKSWPFIPPQKKDTTTPQQATARTDCCSAQHPRHSSRASASRRSIDDREVGMRPGRRARSTGIPRGYCGRSSHIPQKRIRKD